MDPGQIFREHGPTYFPYLVLVCAMFENDVTFLMAGIYAASVRPHLSPSVAVVAGVAGALCHDTFWFALARHRSKWIRETRVWKKIGPQIEQWGYRFGVRELFMARFIPGTRNPSVFFWGLQHLPYHIFVVVNGAALLLWGTILTSLGYKFGQQVESILGKIKQKHLGKYLLVAFLVTLLIYMIIRGITRHEIVKHGKPPEDPRAD